MFQTNSLSGDVTARCKYSLSLTFVMALSTRKSSCVNARGIPTAAYQVLHLWSCWGGGGGYHPSDLDGGGAPCGQKEGWTDTCQNITFPRTTYAVGNNVTAKFVFNILKFISLSPFHSEFHFWAKICFYCRFSFKTFVKAHRICGNQLLRNICFIDVAWKYVWGFFPHWREKVQLGTF